MGLSGFAHRAFLSDFYTGEFPGSFAHGVAFQTNEATGDRRVSGMTAALTGLDAARTAGDAAATDLAIARLLLGHAIVLGWGGIPVLWMGDEIALPSDPDWASEPGHEDDNRWTHRPRMSAAAQAERQVPGTVEHRVFTGLRRLVEARAALPHLHAALASEVLDPSDPGVLPVLRRHPDGDLLELYNVTESPRPWPAARLASFGLLRARDAITGRPVDAEGDLWLAPYEALWLIERE